VTDGEGQDGEPGRAAVVRKAKAPVEHYDRGF
jgi:hypothetical protein